MSSLAKPHQPPRITGSLLRCFLALLILVSSLAAVSTTLHQLLHQDSTAQDHQCVISALAKQTITPATFTPVEVQREPEPLKPGLEYHLPARPFLHLGLDSSRAPPRTA